MVKYFESFNGFLVGIKCKTWNGLWVEVSGSSFDHWLQGCHLSLAHYWQELLPQGHLRQHSRSCFTELTPRSLAVINISHVWGLKCFQLYPFLALEGAGYDIWTTKMVYSPLFCTVRTTEDASLWSYVARIFGIYGVWGALGHQAALGTQRGAWSELSLPPHCCSPANHAHTGLM